MKKKCLIVIASFADGYLDNLLTSIEENTKDVDYEIQVVDNHRDMEKLEECVIPVCEKHNVSLILDTKITGYGDALNTGVNLSTSKSKYILYMDSDTLVEPKWLKRMIDCFKRNKKNGCKMVGPLVQDFNNNYLPGVFELYGNPEEIKTMDDFELTKGYLIGVCILRERETLNEFAWDANYLRAYWEDNDISEQVKFHDGKIFIAGESLMHHKVNSSHETIKKETGSSASRVGASNKAYFLHKWGVLKNIVSNSPVQLAKDMKILRPYTLGTVFTRPDKKAILGFE